MLIKLEGQGYINTDVIIRITEDYGDDCRIAYLSNGESIDIKEKDLQQIIKASLQQNQTGHVSIETKLSDEELAAQIIEGLKSMQVNQKG